MYYIDLICAVVLSLIALRLPCDNAVCIYQQRKEHENKTYWSDVLIQLGKAYPEILAGSTKDDVPDR